MKLAAIAIRGTKKDFVDIYFLLKYFNLKQMPGFYTQKFCEGSEFPVLKSLSNFEDADLDENPKMLNIEKWETMKTLIISTLDKFTRA
jgi:hypothetical protein